jgi:hypothetical protein
MMVSGNYSFSSPGTYFVTAHCMQHERSLPSTTAEFFSLPKAPADSIQRCQQSCGGDQQCVWQCQQGSTAPTPPPSSTARMEWSIADGCNDGRGIAVRLFDKTNNLVWPDGNRQYVAGPGESVNVAIACRRDARICFGAKTDPATNSYWGVGIDGRQGCDNCGYACADTRVGRTLSCN